MSAPASLRLLLVAKAPVPGLTKTRLAGGVGGVAAAEIAASALLDTIAVCRDLVGPARCHLALAGRLEDGVAAAEVTRALEGWSVRPQRGHGFAARLVEAHHGVLGPRVQIGMDTPQLSAADLCAVAAGLTDHDAVLAPAPDGGWWALGARYGGVARPLLSVAMSTPATYADSGDALRAAGWSVTDGPVLRDVDGIEDLAPVAAAAPASRFAAAVERLTPAQSVR